MWIDNKYYTEPELAAYIKELESKVTEFKDFIQLILSFVKMNGDTFNLKSDFYKGYCMALENIQDFIKENMND